jgi:hypothetical protein
LESGNKLRYEALPLGETVTDRNVLMRRGIPDKECGQSVTGQRSARASMSRQYGFWKRPIVEPVLNRHVGEQIETFG